MNTIHDTIHDAVTAESSIAIALPELAKGEKTLITYNGLLSKQGADKVYLHYGFDGWNNVNTVVMNKTHSRTYTAKVRVEGDQEINFCFKDSADNWDNNNGTNWKTEIISQNILRNCRTIEKWTSPEDIKTYILATQLSPSWQKLEIINAEKEIVMSTLTKELIRF